MAQSKLAADDHRWLRTSPEYAMKRLLAAGSGDIFELGRVFRHGESGRNHNPEFTLLEWYRLGWSLPQLMDEVAELVAACGAAFDRSWAPGRLSYRELFLDLAGLDPMDAGPEQLAACAAGHDIDIAGAEDLDRDDWLNLLISRVIQPRLPQDAMNFVFDYPASQAALARIRPGDVPVAERFELFLGSVELANGYRELTDPMEQRERFERENRRRTAKGQKLVVLDENLLAALDHGLPDCSGVALGVDRLLMACLGADHIDQVIPFPHDRA